MTIKGFGILFPRVRISPRNLSYTGILQVKAGGGMRSRPGSLATNCKPWAAFRKSLCGLQFSDELQALGSVSEIVVRINSGGGDVFAAFAIYSRLKDHPAHITVKIDGWAGSAATIIAMAGDTVKIPAAANFMVHNPSMGVLGYYQAQDFRSFADECDTIKDSIVNAYALKTGKDKSEIAAIMSAATWYTGETAVQNGFCNELMFEEIQTEATNTHKIIVNSVEMDLAKLKNVPQSVLNSRPHGGGDCLNHTTQTEQGAGTPKNQKESEETMPEIKTVDELKAAYPDFTKADRKSVV